MSHIEAIQYQGMPPLEKDRELLLMVFDAWNDNPGLINARDERFLRRLGQRPSHWRISNVDRPRLIKLAQDKFRLVIPEALL